MQTCVHLVDLERKKTLHDEYVSYKTSASTQPKASPPTFDNSSPDLGKRITCKYDITDSEFH